MAGDILNPDAISKGAISFLGSAGDTILWIIILVLFIAIAWIIWYILSFKIKIRVREVVQGRTIIKDDKGKIKKDKAGVNWLKLFKYRAKLPLPDTDCLDVTTKGKTVIEYFKSGEDFIPIKVNFDYGEFKKQTGFKGFSSSQRQMMVHECRESEDYNKKTVKDALIQAIPYMVLIILIIGLLIFMPDILETQAKLVNSMGGVVEGLNEVSENFVIASGCKLPNKEVTQPPN